MFEFQWIRLHYFRHLPGLASTVAVLLGKRCREHVVVIRGKLHPPFGAMRRAMAGIDQSLPCEKGSVRRSDMGMNASSPLYCVHDMSLSEREGV